MKSINKIKIIEKPYLLCKSMDWCLYDRDLRHEIVNDLCTHHEKKQPISLNYRSTDCFYVKAILVIIGLKLTMKILEHCFDGVVSGFEKLVAHCVASISLGKCYT